MLFLCFLILSLQKISAQELYVKGTLVQFRKTQAISGGSIPPWIPWARVFHNWTNVKRLPKSVPINDLTFIAYEKRKPMFAEYGKRSGKLPKFAEYGKRMPKFAEYGKRTFSGAGTEWVNKYNALMQWNDFDQNYHLLQILNTQNKINGYIHFGAQSL